VVVIHPARERAALPWKNGGGVTREVVVSPPGSSLDSFSWRVSLAEVSRGGPFSVFAGIDRHMAIVAGHLSLKLGAAAPVILSPTSAPISFPGDLPVSAEPLNGNVTDLNVMTRRGRCQARLRRIALDCSLKLPAGTTLVIAVAPVTLQADTKWYPLDALDAAELEEVTVCRCVARDQSGGGHLYVAHVEAVAA
jgi:uncharacterized protein